MADLVDRCNLYRLLFAEEDNLPDMGRTLDELEAYNKAVTEMLEAVKKVPAIDANEIRGGRTAKIQCADSSCKHCGAPLVLQRRDCPYCGSPYSQAEDRAESLNAIKLPRPMPTLTYDA